MKIRSIIALSAAFAGLSGIASGAISIVAGTTAGPHLFLGNIGAGGSKWNTVPAGASANVYWDADKNGTFGETAKGENSGNAGGIASPGSPALGFNTGAIVGTTVLHFGVEGFGSPGTNQGIDFNLHKTDTSIQRLTILDGGPVVDFSDSNGDQWQASYVFNPGGYGDVVTNVTSVPGGAASDHQGILTLTQIPEPSAIVILFGLAGFGLFVRRRR